MAVKVKQHKGAWWVFIDHKGKRKAKRIGTSKRAADVFVFEHLGLDLATMRAASCTAHANERDTIPSLNHHTK